MWYLSEEIEKDIVGWRIQSWGHEPCEQSQPECDEYILIYLFGPLGLFEIVYQNGGNTIPDHCAILNISEIKSESGLKNTHIQDVPESG